MNSKLKVYVAEFLLIVAISAVIGYLWSLLPGSNQGQTVGLFGALAVAVIFFFYDEKPKGDFKNDRVLIILSFVLEIGLGLVSVVPNVALLVGLAAIESLFRTTISLGTVTDRVAFVWILINLYLGWKEFLQPFLRSINRRKLEFTLEDYWFGAIIGSGLATAILWIIAAILAVFAVPTLSTRGFEQLDLTGFGAIETLTALGVGIFASLITPSGPSRVNDGSFSLSGTVAVTLAWVYFGFCLWAVANAGSDAWVLATPIIHLALFLTALYCLDQNWWWQKGDSFWGRVLSLPTSPSLW